jgi:hypothetical protein
MAQGENFFGIKSGSTKSLTFSVRAGKQIIKDRVYRIKNPRSAMQMRQRILMTAGGLAYKAMKAICDHSFEGVATGQESYSKFMSVNMPLLKADANGNGGRFGYPKYKAGVFSAGSYQISDGSLPVAVRPTIVSVNAENKQLKFHIPLTNMAAFCQDNGLRIGAYQTVCILFPTAQANAYNFGFVRLTMLDDSTEAVTRENVVAKIGANAGGDFRAAVVDYEDGNLAITVIAVGVQANTVGNTYACAINSREGDGIQLRSKASFSCVGMTPTSAQAFATWPVGKDLVLNGGQVVSTGSDSQASDSSQQASTNFQVTTSRTGDYGSAVVSLEVDGSPVASGSYIAAGKTVNVTVTNADNLTDLKVNGQTINHEADGSTVTGSFVMPSRNTVVTAAFPVSQGGDDFDDGN